MREGGSENTHGEDEEGGEDERSRTDRVGEWGREDRVGEGGREDRAGEAGEGLSWSYHGTSLVIDAPDEVVGSVSHAWAFKVEYAR